MRLNLLPLVLLGACHVNCGDNTAARYANFLDGTANCYYKQNGESERYDVAICEVIIRTPDRTGPETWLCTANPVMCRVAGPPIKTVRVP